MPYTHIASPLGKKLGDVTTLNLTMLKVEATRQYIEKKTKDKRQNKKTKIKTQRQRQRQRQ